MMRRSSVYPFPIILASGSPRRRWILRQLGVPFQAVSPRIAEGQACRDALKYVKNAARIKAMEVAGRTRGVVVGVDTIVVLGQRILGKPKGRAQARAMLLALSGRTHRVLSAIFVVDARLRRAMETLVETKVRFRKLSPPEIESYLDTPEPYDKAGAYGIQDRAGFFVESINGSYWNVVGLPVAELLEMLRKMRTALR